MNEIDPETLELLGIINNKVKNTIGDRKIVSSNNIKILERYTSNINELLDLSYVNNKIIMSDKNHVTTVDFGSDSYMSDKIWNLIVTNFKQNF